ncbi:MAG: hypothetical protein EXS37_06750 [Opitutus sp.]|nr:hypothetical protein [Opitutus sp.]
MSAKRTKSLPGRRPVSKAVAAPAAFSETEAWLACAAPPVPPPSARVRKQLLARVAAANAARVVPAGWRFESAAAEAGWRASGAPGVRFKTLSVDPVRDVAMVLVEMAAGSKFPDHLHDVGGDEGIVISGDVYSGGRLMRAGGYYHAAEGTAHVDTVSPGGCTALVSLTARAWNKWHGQAVSR